MEINVAAFGWHATIFVGWALLFVILFAALATAVITNVLFAKVLE